MLAELNAEIKERFKLDVAMQIGLKSDTEDFGVAAGTVRESLFKRRPVTPADTFAYGSGTKSFTAAAVMRLIDAGKVRGDDPCAQYIDPFLERNNGTTTAEIFGPAVLNATVLDLVRMSAGIPDFESTPQGSPQGNSYDKEVLEHGRRVWPPYGSIRFSASMPWPGPGGKLYCYPGTCGAYSSTSYQLAGLLLAALQVPGGNWTDLDLGDIALPNRSRYPSLRFPPARGAASLAHARMSDTLTVYGRAAMPSWPHSIIYDQNPSILGWTCGNMIGAATDVARWYYDLLATPGTVVSQASLKEMERLEPLTYGWSTGMPYGAGLMLSSLSNNKTNYTEGLAIGHAGLTYGFSSSQGGSASIAPGAKVAFSVATNTDVPFFSTIAGCRMAEIVRKVYTGADAHFNCTRLVDLPHGAVRLAGADAAAEAVLV